MKIADVKHNHSLTDLLKILLFTILMLAPIGMVATRCLYVIANKNAYQSYSETRVDKIEQINNAQSYTDTFTYNVKPITTSHGTSPKQRFTYISIDGLNVNSTQFSIYSNQTNANLIMFWDDENNETERYTWGNPNGTNSFDEFYFTKESGTSLFEYANVFLIYETTEKLDNVFEYSVSKLEESTLFNWTENTAIFSGINTMNTQLGINSTAIGIILTYWLILTCIYVIIDIVLKLFTILTHMIGRKT